MKCKDEKYNVYVNMITSDSQRKKDGIHWFIKCYDVIGIQMMSHYPKLDFGLNTSCIRHAKLHIRLKIMSIVTFQSDHSYIWYQTKRIQHNLADIEHWIKILFQKDWLLQSIYSLYKYIISEYKFMINRMIHSVIHITCLIGLTVKHQP